MRPIALTIKILSMREYFGATMASRDWLFPSGPALYIWTMDFRRFRNLAADEGIDELQAVLQLGPQVFRGRLEPYYLAEVKDAARPLTANKVAKLKQIARNDSSGLNWILLCGSVLQRPLYVGKASSLSSRVKSHVQPASRLNSYLDECGIRLIDCSIHFIDSPFPAPTEDAEGPSSDDWDISEDEGGPILDVVEAIVTRTTKPLLARRQE